MKTFLKNILSSFLDKGFGAKIRVESLNKSMIYLFILMLFIESPKIIMPEIELFTQSRDVVDFLKTDAPDFELKNGRFHFYGTMPFIVYLDNDCRDVLIVDTSGQMVEESLKKYNKGIYISDTRMVFKQNKHKTESYDFKDHKNFNLTKSKLIFYFEYLTIPLLLLYILLRFLLNYMVKLFEVFLLSLVALLLNKILKAKIDYQNIFKISIYAIVLPSLIYSVIDVFEFKIPYFYIVNSGIAIFYLFRYILSFNELTNIELQQEKDSYQYNAQDN